MLFVSDVHGAAGPLRKLVELGEPLVVLGDFVNLTDYRNGQGAVADVLGAERLDLIHSVHTDKGYHKSQRIPLAQWLPQEVVAESDALGDEEARALLARWM